MKREKMPEKWKSLMDALQKNHWEVVSIEDDFSDWALQEKWQIHSLTKSRGLILELWFFHHNGEHDGMHRVIVTPHNASEPNPYGGEIALDFDGRKLEKKMLRFIQKLNHIRDYE